MAFVPYDINKTAYQHMYPSSAPTTPAVDPTAALTSGPVFGYNPSYGGVPSVPSPAATQASAISGNLGNLGNLYNLASSVNQFNQGQAGLGLQTNLPGYQGMLGQAVQNTSQLQRGIIPSDVTNQLYQLGAERGTGRGFGTDSPNTNAALMRAFGLTSLGLQQQGQQQFGQLVGLTPQAQSFNPASFFVTPEQQQQAQAAQNLYGSALIPAYASSAAMNALRSGLGTGKAAAAPAVDPFFSAPSTAPASWRTQAYNAYWNPPAQTAAPAPVQPAAPAATSWYNAPSATPGQYGPSDVPMAPTDMMGGGPDFSTTQPYGDQFWANLTPSDFDFYT